MASFCGKGKAVLSSLAAAAGVGDTVGNSGEEKSNLQHLKDAKRRRSTTPDSGMPICAKRAALKYFVK
jgi:hypothetical protein